MDRNAHYLTKIHIVQKAKGAINRMLVQLLETHLNYIFFFSFFFLLGIALTNLGDI